MTEFQKTMQREALLPILLGDSFAAHKVAVKLYLRVGVKSYVCDSRRGFWSFIDPASSFFDLISVKEGIAVRSALDAISKNKDYLPVLVPCNAHFEAFVKENIDFLEPRFILASKEDIFRSAPIAALMKGE